MSWVDLNVDRALTLHSPSLAQSPFSVDPIGPFTDLNGAQFLIFLFDFFNILNISAPP